MAFDSLHSPPAYYLNRDILLRTITERDRERKKDDDTLFRVKLKVSILDESRSATC